MLQGKAFFVSIPAHDIHRAKAFFAEKLGMQPAVEMDFAIAYQQGDMRFQIVQSALCRAS